MNRTDWKRCGLLCAVGLGFLTLSGCATVTRERDPVPQHLVDEAEIPGIPSARYWGDRSSDHHEAWLKSSNKDARVGYAGIIGKPHAYLGISGGGANGAYGAGVLCGWTQTGNRPEFTMVTGISTGSIIAPFVFLGPDYDPVLKALYGEMSTEDVLIKRGLFKGIRGDAFSELTPLRETLRGYIGDEEVRLLAAEYNKGRRLYIGTVNMDSLRPVTWDIGRIAASGDPKAKELIVEIIIASASIPIAFPPVFIDVEVDGEIYQEMHVDGGLAAQVFVYPSSLNWSEVTKRLSPKGTPHVYVIRNAKLDPKWEAVEAKVAPLAGRTIASMIRTQGIGDLEEIALATERDGMDSSLTYIPADFDAESNEAFDPEYMKALYQVGYDDMLSGTVWTER